jgi:ATP-dependent Zn protease
VLLFGFDLPDEPGAGRRLEAMSFGKSRETHDSDSPKIGFKDVAGVTRRSRSCTIKGSRT